MWYQHEAIALCKRLEEIAPQFGAHVALTGGCLYKDGARADCDIMFYRIRQEEVDEAELLQHLVKFEGFSLRGRYGWVQKAVYKGKSVDLFFPNFTGAEYVPTGNTGRVPGQHDDKGY